MDCSASESKAVKMLILKPHLIPLIPAKFLAQSGKTDLKVITCTECNSAAAEQCLRHSHRGHGTEGDPFGMGQVQQSRAPVPALMCPPLLSTTYRNLDPFRSFPMFGELGLITSLKDSIWKLESVYLENLFEFLYLTLFHLHNTGERCCRSHGWGKSHHKHPSPKEGMPKHLQVDEKNKNWENKHEVTQAMPWLGVMTGLKKKKGEVGEYTEILSHLLCIQAESMYKKLPVLKILMWKKYPHWKKKH